MYEGLSSSASPPPAPLPLPADAAYCPRCSTVSLEDADSCAQCPK